jgi:hypothetical protein
MSYKSIPISIPNVKGEYPINGFHPGPASGSASSNESLKPEYLYRPRSLQSNHYYNRFRDDGFSNFDSSYQYQKPGSYDLNANILSKSWSHNERSKFVKYDVLNNAQGAGIIPYTYRDDELMFLFQKTIFPDTTKNRGWNDFGGKRDDKLDVDSKQTACREFSEETSCLFYLKEHNNTDNDLLYAEISKSDTFKPESLDALRDNFTPSRDYYLDRINTYDSDKFNLHIKEIYVSYFCWVPWIHQDDFPEHEDIHMYYEYRYVRECRWLTIDEVLALDDGEFHKRLQIMKIKNKIQDLWEQKLFYDH